MPIIYPIIMMNTRTKRCVFMENVCDIDLAYQARVSMVVRTNVSPLPAPQLERDVHTSHCCVHHGCKYGEDKLEESITDEGESFIPCSVVGGRRIQEHPCERCDWEEGLEELRNGPRAIVEPPKFEDLFTSDKTFNQFLRK